MLAGLIVFDGFFGPPIAAMNLAGVLPWIHWRGLVVLGLLASGNVFCMACPFMLPRTLARRLSTATRAWPSWLRNKWPAVFLVVAFLWAYEAFALWDSPWLTAAIIVAFFALAFLIDGLFRGASFCKYVCPIGQFNFVQSLVSPLEIKVLDLDVCSSCRTKDCIRGRDDIPGCELGLYQPRKSSNMDCTFCLDCIHACPHQNIGIVANVPGGGALARPSPVRHRPIQPAHRPGRIVRGVGLRRLRECRIDDRPALGCAGSHHERIGPRLTVPRHDRSLSDRTGRSASLRQWRAPRRSLAAGAACLTALVEIAARYAYALIPLGFGMWLAHYSFHFLTGYAERGPDGPALLRRSGMDRPRIARLDAAQRAFLRLSGCSVSRSCSSIWACCFRSTPAIASPSRRPSDCRRHSRRSRRGRFSCRLLFAAGIWIVFQPMQMRGMMQMAR